MKKMTGLSSSNKTIVSDNEFMLANDLNYFFCHFESDSHFERFTDLVRPITLTDANPRKAYRS